MTEGTEETNGCEASAEVCVAETEIGAEDRVKKLEDCVTGKIMLHDLMTV